MCLLFALGAVERQPTGVWFPFYGAPELSGEFGHWVCGNTKCWIRGQRESGGRSSTSVAITVGYAVVEGRLQFSISSSMLGKLANLGGDSSFSDHTVVRCIRPGLRLLQVARLHGAGASTNVWTVQRVGVQTPMRGFGTLRCFGALHEFIMQREVVPNWIL